MHCASSFPGYYFARELIPGAIAIPCPPMNSGITWRSGTGYNDQPPRPSVDHYMVCNKEVMRRTMLNHEAMFRYQVHELHRLYRRQKELMNELKMRSRQLQTSSLDPITSLMQTDLSQKSSFAPGWQVIKPTGSDLSFLSAGKFQGPLLAVLSQHTDANSNPMKVGKNQVKLMPTETTKFRKRILDLELPGDHYLDSEDEENIVENVANVPKLQCHPPKESPAFLNESDSKLCSLHFIGSASLNSSYGRNSCLIDLNEPVQLDESEFPISSSHARPSVCCKNSSDRCIINTSERNPCFRSVISYPTICDGNATSERGSPPNCCKNIDHLKSFKNANLNFSAPRCSSETATSPENGRCADGEDEMEYSVNALGSTRKPFFYGEAPGFLFHAKSGSKSDPLEVKDIESGKDEGKIDSRLDSSVKWIKDDSAVNMGIGSNVSNFNSFIDLNSCANEDVPSLASTRSRPCIGIGVLRERDLEGPLSPENKESSPPRGESEDMQLEIPIQLVKDDQNIIQELDKVAAETIISMSSCGVPVCLEQVTTEPPEPLADYLEWFAKVVSSIAAILENEDAKFQTGATDSDVNELSSDESNYLRTNKLQQTAKECEDFRYKSNENKKKDTDDESLPRQQGCRRKGKKRKVVRKKAMHALGVLGRATGVCLGNVTKRNRNLGQNDFAKWTSNDEHIMNQPLKFGAKNKHTRCLRGWGSQKGRRRARMARPSFHDFFSFG